MFILYFVHIPVSFSLGKAFRIIFSILIALKYVSSGISVTTTSTESLFSSFLSLFLAFLSDFVSNFCPLSVVTLDFLDFLLGETVTSKLIFSASLEPDLVLLFLCLTVVQSMSDSCSEFWLPFAESESQGLDYQI